MTRVHLAILAGALALAAPVYAESQRLTFIGAAGPAPYQYLDAEGQPQGFNIELMRALSRETHIPIGIRLVADDTVLSRVERGEADLVCLAYTPAREERFTWLLPLWRLRQVAVFARRPARPVTSIRDLAGERVAASQGSLFWEELQALPLEQRPTLLPIPDREYIHAAQMLRNGEATVIVGNALPMRSIFRSFSDLHEVTLRSMPYYLAATPGRADLVPVFFAAFTRLQESGEFNAIVERTLLAERNSEWWDTGAEYVAAAAAVGLLAFLAVVAWNRSLRAQVETRTTEIRAAAEQLSFHAHVLSQVTDAIIVLCDDMRITSWNAGAEQLFGMPAHEAIGRSSADLFAGALTPMDIAQIRADVATAGVWRGERLIRMPNGSTRYVEAIVQALKSRDGRPAGRLIVLHDIHERKTSEMERQRLEQQIQQVQKLESLGVLAGGIAHDFNNLLVGMLGHAGLALLETPPDSPLRDRIQQIETCAVRAADLTNQMLAYSGKGRFVVQPIDISDVVREMTNLLQTAISKSARLDLRLAESHIVISGDPTQLRQVVMNLLTNASDALGDRTGTITIETGVMHATRADLSDTYAAAVEPGEYAFLEVRDTGCGMDEQTRQRIFDPFFTTKFAGRGLGLAAVLGIVRGHRGAVKIQSAPGRGTTFRVLFPACRAALEPKAAGPAQVNARRRARVLIVDDEPSVRAIARETLLRAGFTVVVAADGREALEHVKTEGDGIDAVLMDMTMPGLSGIETLRAIHGIMPVPVVLTSGYSEQEAVDRCANEQFAGFIQKPFKPAELVAKLNEAIAS